MTTTLSRLEGQKLLSKPKRSKYGNVKTERHGILFDSVKEADRYDQLLLLEKAGEIRNLERQPKLPLYSGNTPVRGDTGIHMSYIGDFAYFEAGSNKRVIEDVKSKATKTRLYKLKKAVLLATYPGIEIREV